MTVLDRLETNRFVESMPDTMSIHDKKLAFMAFTATHQMPGDASLERDNIVRLLNRFVELAAESQLDKEST